MVSKYQNVIMKGKQILDAMLIENKVIDYMLKSNAWCGVSCKLDIKKAYDHINWNFLLVILGKMNFRQKWIGWIK